MSGKLISDLSSIGGGVSNDVVIPCSQDGTDLNKCSFKDIRTLPSGTSFDFLDESGNRLGFIDCPTFNDGSSQLRFFIRQTGNTYKGLVLNTLNDILGFWNHETLTSYPVPYLITYSYGSDGTWYRKWSDGFIEQGGQTPTLGQDASYTVTFPIAFSSNVYTVELTRLAGSGDWTPHVNSRSTTSMYLINNSGAGGSNILMWNACGY